MGMTGSRSLSMIGQKPAPRQPTLGATDHDRIVALGATFLGHRRPSPQQVDLDQVSRAAEQFASLRQIRLAILAGPLVRGAEELDDRHQLPAFAVPDSRIGHIASCEGRMSIALTGQNRCDSH